jgi:hypothetical protein
MSTSWILCSPSKIILGTSKDSSALQIVHAVVMDKDVGFGQCEMPAESFSHHLYFEADGERYYGGIQIKLTVSTEQEDIDDSAFWSSPRQGRWRSQKYADRV